MGHLSAELCSEQDLSPLQRSPHLQVVGAFTYAYVVYGLLPGKPWARGLLWGLGLWAVMQVMPLPMMGKGFFASKTPQPLLFVMGTLMGYVVYGSVFGALAGRQASRRSQPLPVHAS